MSACTDDIPSEWCVGARGCGLAESDGSLVPERILELSERLSSVAGAKIGEISSINREAKMLAINALIAAARAGEAGRGFAIVSEEFKRISQEIDEVAQALESQVRADLQELSLVGGAILSHLRGPAPGRPGAERHRDHRPQPL